MFALLVAWVIAWVLDGPRPSPDP